ncbi:MAG: hypothetical protein ACK529_06520, partial [Alphaproteobacteria bacterium]
MSAKPMPVSGRKKPKRRCAKVVFDSARFNAPHPPGDFAVHRPFWVGVKTTQAKKYTVADLIKRYLDYQKTRNPKRANAVEMYLDWWKSEIGAYALADVTKTLIIEKRDKLIATGKNVERRSAGTANRYMGA